MEIAHTLLGFVNNVTNILIAKEDIYSSRESVNLGDYVYAFELILFEIKRVVTLLLLQLN